MIKQAPTLGRILAMVVFSLSCFGILLYLWVAFGGPIPLKAQGYRFSADFKEATLIAQNADVRISGVSVGKIVKSDQRENVTRMQLEMKPEYAPIPADTRAILRRKTALGEAYIELSPGTASGPKLADEGHLPSTQVEGTVELDELVREFDEPTRDALKKFVTGLSIALDGRGQDINNALGSLEPLAIDGAAIARTLDRQHEAVRHLVGDTGTIFESLGGRQGELSALVRAGERVLRTTAARDRDLAETTRILPTTLRELEPTFEQLAAFSREAAPVISALRPAGRALGSTLIDLRATAPELSGLFDGLNAVIRVAPVALPALTRTVRGSQPLFGSLADALRDLLPVVQYLGLYKTELNAQLANVGAANEASEIADGGNRRRYLRTVAPFTIEGLMVQPQRFGTNRHNAYFNPRALDKLATGLEAFDCENVGNLSFPGTPAPDCKVQAPLEFQGRRTAFPQLKRLAP
jgi:virulence factor Mce-like protein